MLLPLPVNASVEGAELASGQGVPLSGEVGFRVGISFILPDRVQVDDKREFRAWGIGDSSRSGFHARIRPIEKLGTASGTLEKPVACFTGATERAALYTDGGLSIEG